MNISWSDSVRAFNIIVFSPIIEEIVLRGFLYSPYRKKYGPKIAVVITGLFFSAYHPTKAFGAVLIHGIFHGILYEKTESIIPPIIAHSTSNLLVNLTPLAVNLLFNQS